MIASIDKMPYSSLSNSYSYLSEQDNDYHFLPDLDDLCREGGTKTVKQAKRDGGEIVESLRRGKPKSTRTSLISENKLKKIWTDWWNSFSGGVYCYMSNKDNKEKWLYAPEFGLLAVD
ncbi:22742_t:CDS:2 [Dentiscutata erythropus]|uniref:22742_t:CDS:1 n=1 Tax=Dentiscutata erythropus TaxID=1348616 RepID=A0A9N9J8L0_9GLOM|nr:22742_t:CDS:2 [Dentiscutata erythropus]